jgi:tRNA modification GTPase
VLDDTIAAISTPVGAAGISIIRVSGSESLPLVDKVFRSKKNRKLKAVPNFSFVYGNVIDDKGKKIDEVLVSVMRGPHSFTAENVVEINCHGGIIATRRILETLLAVGARLAEPGEFSKRAFLNGRIDLAQAEAIIDLINAKTEKSLKYAVIQLDGALSSEIKTIRNEILELMANIEAGIDFPEHDIEELSRRQIKTKTIESLEKINKLLKSAGTGKVFREGLKTVIIGKPNVGKSSLLNALLKEKRAIVTDIPGTTRDIIEEVVSIRGIPLRLIDTAGIRETEDIIEKIGVEKTREVFAEADLVLFMIDASTGLTEHDREIFPLLKEKRNIVLINKTDVNKEIDTSEIEKIVDKSNIMEISVLYGNGMKELEDLIEEIVYDGIAAGQEEVLVTNIRHKNILEKAQTDIKAVLRAIANQLPTDCMAIDLRAAWELLGEITGETIGEDLVDTIFSRFCIGK